jgi:hypothetical protein
VRRGAFPESTFVTELNLVNSGLNDSLYVDTQYMRKMSDSTLAALRARASYTQPHNTPAGGSVAYTTYAALGWREPELRRIAALGRWTWTGNDARDPTLPDRHARIALLGANYIFDPSDNATARWTRRLDRDETVGPPYPRRTTMTMARWVHDMSERRSISAHLARRCDDFDGCAPGMGTELGLALSNQITVAIGYNPKGFRDRELEIDERLEQGWTLRLRFNIVAAIGRWLDTPIAEGSR